MRIFHDFLTDCRDSIKGIEWKVRHLCCFVDYGSYLNQQVAPGAKLKLQTSEARGDT